MVEAAIFYIFSAVLILSALMVITAKNPVHAVLFLILAFFNAAGLFIMAGAEFVAMILVIVYVGAVAVLFLFVVMMLDINFSNLRQGTMQYVPLGLLLGFVLLAQLVMLYLNWSTLNVPPDYTMKPLDPNNTHALGQVLYTHYIVPFQIAGLVLFVAMIGAIVLTHRKRPGVRRQDVSAQNARQPEDVLSLHKVETGKGIDL